MKTGARRFLLGLSSDELQFIAEFYGACILEEPAACVRNRAELAAWIADFQRARGATSRVADQDHKMILLLEYLCRAGAPAQPIQPIQPPPRRFSASA